MRQDTGNPLITNAKGVQDLADLMLTIVNLYRAGILLDPTQTPSDWKPDTAGFGAAPVHVAMLNDRARTASFLSGIREVVRPGDVVVDIGTGTGILSIAAVQAGAAHVYAIEASRIADIANSLFSANRMADRITLIRGWSTQVELPERADVLISEVIGNDPLSENVLGVMADAYKRLVKPHARCVPSGLQIFGLPVTLPSEIKEQRLIADDTLQNWSTWYNMDFSPLAELAYKAPAYQLGRPQVARGWPTLSDPVLLAEFDLQSITDQHVSQTIHVNAQASGQLDGLLLYFDLTLGPNTHFSTHPKQADDQNHWDSPLRRVDPPLILESGDPFEIHYQYGARYMGSVVEVSKGSTA